MQAGNAFYQTVEDLPQNLPILVLPQLMLLPGGFVPVTIEQDDGITLVNDALKGNRLVGIVQPIPRADLNIGQVLQNHVKANMVVQENQKTNHSLTPTKNALYDIGCMGRITNYSEIGDGSLLISLQGICRFRLRQPLERGYPYPFYAVEAFAHDLDGETDETEIDRDTFLNVFRNYLNIHDMQADWKTILEAPDETLVNALSIIAPFDAAAKQALLEADNVKSRSETLIALAERYMMEQGIYGHSLQ